MFCEMFANYTGHYECQFVKRRHISISGSFSGKTIHPEKFRADWVCEFGADSRQSQQVPSTDSRQSQQILGEARLSRSKNHLGPRLEALGECEASRREPLWGGAGLRTLSVRRPPRESPTPSTPRPRAQGPRTASCSGPSEPQSPPPRPPVVLGPLEPS